MFELNHKPQAQDGRERWDTVGTLRADGHEDTGIVWQASLPSLACGQLEAVESGGFWKLPEVTSQFCGRGISADSGRESWQEETCTRASSATGRTRGQRQPPPQPAQAGSHCTGPQAMAVPEQPPLAFGSERA